MQIHGVEYEFTLGSDVLRNGMFLEASVAEPGSSVVVAEVFWSDESGRFFVNCWERDVPMELIELLIKEGKYALPRVSYPQE